MITTDQRIALSFKWVGSNQWGGGWSKGGLDVNVVDLLFEDMKTKISVHLPRPLSPLSIQKFPFTCSKLNPPQKITPDIIRVELCKFKNLNLRIAYFDMDPKQVHCKIECSKVIRQGLLRRIDRVIKPLLPQEIVPEKKYTLVINSDEFFCFSAKVIEDELLIDQKMDEFSERSRIVTETPIESGDLKKFLELDFFSIDQLQSLLDEKYLKSKEFERLEIEATMSKDFDVRGKMIQEEISLYKEIVEVKHALKRKGVTD